MRRKRKRFPAPAKVRAELEDVRRLLRRWGAAPERIALRGSELSELNEKLNGLIGPSAADPSAAAADPMPGDPVLVSVILREELTERCRSRMRELEELIRHEYAFCHAVERAIESLPPREERLLRLFYRDRTDMDQLAQMFLLSRAQLFRVRRAAELALAPILTDAA